MLKLRAILTILAVLVLLLIPLAALADTAPESTVADGLWWGEGINGNFAHNTWYSADRHWVMYIYADNVVYGSSADYGVTWDYIGVTSGTQTIFRGLAIWYDELTNLVHYARVEQRPGNTTDGDIIYYRAGTPLPDGTISWIELEVAIDNGGVSTGVIGTVTIACDKLGYPYVAWTEDNYNMGNLTGHFWPEVDGSDSNTGTWPTPGGDPWNDWSNGSNHDYDTAYGDGNWTAIAVSLVPIEGAGSATMHLAWSIGEGENTAEFDELDTVGIDSSIYNVLGNVTSWGNCSWVVPLDPTYGLFTDVMGEIAFSFYNIDTTVYCVYGNWMGDLLYNAKPGATDWEDINGPGNWTDILAVPGYNMPAIAGYSDSDDLIVVYHDRDSLYYDTKPAGGAFTGTWTKIWDIDDHTIAPAHDIFLHSLQYRYGADSPVGFAWDWGTLEWGNTSQSGTLSYWFIDKDGGANPLGYYAGTPASTFGLAWLMMGFLGIIILLMVVVSLFRTESKEPQNYLIIAIMGLLAATIVIALVQSFS